MDSTKAVKARALASMDNALLAKMHFLNRPKAPEALLLHGAAPLHERDGGRLVHKVGVAVVLREVARVEPALDGGHLAPAARAHLVAAEVDEVVGEEAARRARRRGFAAGALAEHGVDELPRGVGSHVERRRARGRGAHLGVCGGRGGGGSR